MIDHSEKAAKQQAVANWEKLVGLGTPKAVQQIVKEGIEDGDPQEATIIALDCLSRIGTSAAVKGISQYFLILRL